MSVFENTHFNMNFDETFLATDRHVTSKIALAVKVYHFELGENIRGYSVVLVVKACAFEEFKDG